MRNEFLTKADISGFRMHLLAAEKSAATELKAGASQLVPGEEKLADGGCPICQLR